MKVTTDACLLGAIVSSLVQKEGSLKVLDIGTGTGLLALMFAQQNEKAKIDAIETDEDAAAQAIDNVAASPWPNRFTVICGDVKNFHPNDKYDTIISNPPFYENDLKSGSTSKNKAHHDEGLLLAELFAVINNLLAPDGRFFVLLPYKRKAEAEMLMDATLLKTSRRILIRQSVKHDYFRLIVEGRHLTESNGPVLESEMAIRDENQQYTPNFTDLLKDYYLHL